METHIGENSRVDEISLLSTLRPAVKKLGASLFAFFDIRKDLVVLRF